MKQTNLQLSTNRKMNYLISILCYSIYEFEATDQEKLEQIIYKILETNTNSFLQKGLAEYMCEDIEKIKFEMAKLMITEKQNINLISRITNLSIVEIRKLGLEYV